MEHSAVNYKELHKKRSESLIENRKIIEMNVNDFLSRVVKLLEIEPERMSSLSHLKDKTCTDLFPSLWQEPFDRSKHQAYLEELESFKQLINEFAVIGDAFNKEACECL